MRFRILAPTLSLLAALTLTFAGCNRESPKGGAGADNKGKATGTAGTNDNKDTFTIKVPAGNTNVTQGESKEIAISVSRGSSFDQDVTVTFKPQEGLSVTPDTWTAKKGADDGKIVVKAADTATVGSTNIKVTGTPKTGKETSVDLGIDVKKKS